MTRQESELIKNLQSIYPHLNKIHFTQVGEEVGKRAALIAHKLSDKDGYVNLVRNKSSKSNKSRRNDE